MKIQINNIYDDNNTLVATNPLVANEPRLHSVYLLANDLDLIIENSYGCRELLKKCLKEDDTEVYTYNLTKVHKTVYVCLLENIHKYEMLLQADASTDTITPLDQYTKTVSYGQKVRTENMASRVDTTSHGDIDTTTNVGQTSETNNVGARDVTNSVTSFSSSTFNDTDKSVSTASIDSTTYGSRQDTEKIQRGNDTLTHGAHQDTITDSAHSVIESGTNDSAKQLTDFRRYAEYNTLKEISNDIVNAVSYGLYLF